MSPQDVINFFRFYGTIPQIGMVLAVLLFLVCAVFGRRTTRDASASGQVLGQVTTSESSDLGSIEVTVTPSDASPTIDKHGKFEIKELKLNRAYSVRFSCRGYHPQELSNILATEDGSYRIPATVLVRNTEFGWERRNAEATPYKITTGAELSSKEIMIGSNGSPTSLMSTLNEGVAWKTMTSLPIELHSLMQTRDGLLFVSGRKQYPGEWGFGCILQSGDGGVTWKEVSPPLYLSFVNSLTETPSGRMLAVTACSVGHGIQATLLLSDDKGTTWKTGQQMPAYDKLIGLSLVTNGSLICAGTKVPPTIPPQIYVSKDNGETWATCSSPPLNEFNSIVGFTSTGKGTLFVAANRPNEDSFASALYRSDNGGQYWRLVGQIPALRYVKSLSRAF